MRVDEIQPYGLRVDKDWLYYDLFRNTIKVKYDRVKQVEDNKKIKREMRQMHSDDYDEMITINATAFATDAYNETKRLLTTYIGKMYDVEQHKEELYRLVRTTPVPEIFKCYDGNLILITSDGKEFRIAKQEVGKEMSKYGSLLKRLQFNGYLNLLQNRK